MNDFTSGSNAPTLLRLVEWFAPPASKSNPKRRRRARIFIAANLILAPLSALIGTVFALVGGLPPFGAAGFAVAAIIAAVNPFFLRQYPSWQRALSWLFLAEILTVFAFQSAIDAGIRDPSILIIITLPWLAALLLGPIGSFYWSGIVSTLLLIFYVLHQYGIAHPDPSPEEAHWWFQLIAGTLATLLVGYMGYTYKHRQAQAREALRRQRQQAQQRTQRLARERDAIIDERSEARDQAERRIQEHEQRFSRMSRDIRQEVMHLAGRHAALARSYAGASGSPSDSADPLCQEIVEKASSKILHVLDSAEELARLDAAAPETERQSLDLQELLEAVLEDILQDGSEGEIAPVVFYEAPPFEPLVQSDAYHLSRALSLLAERAFRSYPNGEVTVSIERARQSTEGEVGECLEVRVVLRRHGAERASGVSFGAHASGAVAREATGQSLSGEALDLQLAGRLAQLAGGVLHVSVGRDRETFALSVPRSRV